MLRLSLASSVPLEQNSVRMQRRAHHVILVVNTKMKIMLRLPLAKFVPLEKNSIRRQLRVICVRKADIILCRVVPWIFLVVGVIRVVD